MTIAISGFGSDNRMNDFLKSNGYIISDTVSDDTKCVITKENLEYIEFKSAKIKRALTKNIPILSSEDLNKENILKLLKKLNH